MEKKHQETTQVLCRKVHFFCRSKMDTVVKSQKVPVSVIPAKLVLDHMIGEWESGYFLMFRVPDLARHAGFGPFYDNVKVEPQKKK